MRSPARLLIAVLLGTASTLAGTPAAAQGVARSFNQLQVLVHPGDAIRVVDESGREVRGRIEQVTDATLRLLVRSRTEELAESQVAQIFQRRSDPLGNGALWGLAIGAGLVGVAGLVEPPRRDETGFYVLALVVYAGAGAGVGVGIDALIRRERLVFERQPAGRATEVRLAPILGRGRKGLMLSLRF
jgi:hypothetical protein